MPEGNGLPTDAAVAPISLGRGRALRGAVCRRTLGTSGLLAGGGSITEGVTDSPRISLSDRVPFFESTLAVSGPSTLAGRGAAVHARRL